jgi:hypothetical protein
MFPTRKNNSQILFLFMLLWMIFISTNKIFGQDDLLKVLQSETPVKNEKVIATFKGNKIINIETNETVRKNNLDVRVSHLFGNMGAEGGGGIHNFYGIDQSADIRIGFHYGLTDRLMLGVARSKRNENFEGLVKYRVLEQTTDGSMPFSMTLYSNMTYSIKSSEVIAKDVYRLTYCTQAIFAYKYSTKFSVALTPGFLHRNFVEAGDENNTYSLSGGFRFKFTRSASIISDYSHTFGRNDVVQDYKDVFGLGVEIETGGHVFSIMFTNASGILENDYLVNTVDSWGHGGVKFSFHISRMFRMTKKDPVD